MLIPSSLLFKYSHSGSLYCRTSLFCKKIISEVTLVPAFLEKVSFGSLIAPIKSALSAMYFLNELFALSSVPLLVIKAIIPPALTLSKVFAKK